LSIIVQGSASVGGQNGLFHASDFFIRQEIEVARAFPCGESAIVLQTEANKKVDFLVRHVHDLLDGFLGLVVVGQECQFAGKFRIDGLIDKSGERFRLGCYIESESHV
jgi:hypothetical protein